MIELFIFVVAWASGLFFGWCVFAPARSKRYVIAFDDAYYLSQYGSTCTHKTMHADRAFVFRTYALAEKTALKIGGRVEEKRP